MLNTKWFVDKLGYIVSGHIGFPATPPKTRNNQFLAISTYLQLVNSQLLVSLASYNHTFTTVPKKSKRALRLRLVQKGFVIWGNSWQKIFSLMHHNLNERLQWI